MGHPESKEAPSLPRISAWTERSSLNAQLTLMTLLPLDEALHIVSQSDDLQKGEVCAHSEYITDQVQDAASSQALQNLSLDFKEQHAIVSAEVGRVGMRYRWVNSFALRGADLNGEKKFIQFEPSSKLSVQPVSLGAKAVRFAPHLVPVDSIVPGASMAVNYIGKCLIDLLAKRVVDGQVQTEFEEQGTEIREEIWTYRFDAETPGGHPAFTKVIVPFVGPRALFGDVILVRSVSLKDQKVKLQLGINPLIVEMSQALMPESLKERVRQLSVAGSRSSEETNRSHTRKESEESSAGGLSSVTMSWLKGDGELFQRGKSVITKAIGNYASGEEFELADLESTLAPEKKEQIANDYDEGTPDVPVDSEWADSIKQMEVKSPDTLMEGLGDAGVIEFAASELL